MPNSSSMKRLRPEEIRLVRVPLIRRYALGAILPCGHVGTISRRPGGRFRCRFFLRRRRGGDLRFDVLFDRLDEATTEIARAWNHERPTRN